MDRKETFNEFVKVITYMGTKKWTYIIGMFSHVIIAIAYSTGFSFVYKFMINAIEKRIYKLLLNALILSCVIIIAICIIDPLLCYIYSKILNKTINKIRFLALERISELPMNFFSKNHSGDLFSTLTNDMNIIKNAYGNNVFSLLFSILYGIASMTAMIILEWRLSIFMIVLGIASVRINLMFVKSMRKLANNIQKQNSVLTQCFSDVVSGIRVIHMFNCCSKSSIYS